MASEAVDAKLEVLSNSDMGWLYLGLFLAQMLQLLIGLAAGVARRDAKVNPPDQHAYVVKGAEGSKLGYVLLETEGALGRFNRAQRGMMNYHENFPTVCFHFIASSFVFPKQAFGCMMLYCVGTILNAEGYRIDANGRTNGFGLVVPAVVTLQGMILFVALETLL